jgi:dipeptidyl aminopeptidase/acylaminoacyl peptidase
LAYGTDFLYLYVEAEADRLTFRDRAYQNGDGFTMVIAAPRPDDEPTDEFYVLACSAVNKPSLEWTRRIFYCYNVDQIFLRPSGETKLEFREKQGRISFELILPWQDIHPYHPWISEEMGFNLNFVKAVGEKDLNVYKVIPGSVYAENSPRWYARLRFEEPVVSRKTQTFVTASRGNVQRGEPIHAIAVTAAPTAATEEVISEVRQRQGEDSHETRARYECESGLTHHQFEIMPADLPQGDYVFEWRSGDGGRQGGLQVTVLPRFDRGLLDRQLTKAEANVTPGSYTTLEYKIERLESLLRELPPYEVASYERSVSVRLQEDMDRALRGEDPYALRKGALRRAFRSRLDETLQPYVVYIPEDYDQAQTYPLLVFLHGSGTTETEILSFPFLSPGKFIGMGPFGRGRSNGFATDEAQRDIAEAIDDVIANYPIDTERIILAGFSMGGYGVYRTYWETPDKFKALVVLSGLTRFGDGSLDFRKIDLQPFRGMPMFVFHGEKDWNVSYDQAVDLVGKLRAAGARVEFHSEPNKGHEVPSDATIKKYHAWLKAIVSEG